MNEKAPRAPKMPPEIAKALIQVMKGIPRLTKGELNTHGRYNFASIDDFLEATRDLLAEAGLIIVQQEEKVEIREQPGMGGRGDGDFSKGVRAWVVIEFSFWLIHESGIVWDYRMMRTGIVNAAMGSQALGAAQSYALKQFMRSLFKIATGDKEDVDHQKQEPLAPDPTLAIISADEWKKRIAEADRPSALTEVGRLLKQASNHLTDFEVDDLRAVYDAKAAIFRKQQGSRETPPPAVEGGPVEIQALDEPDKAADDWIAQLALLPTEAEVRDFATDNSIWERIETKVFAPRTAAKLEDALNAALARTAAGDVEQPNLLPDPKGDA